MEPALVAGLAAVVVAVITWGGAWFAQRAQRTSTTTKTALSLLEPLKKRVTTLELSEASLEIIIADYEVRIAALEEEVQLLRLWAQVLWRQVIDLGGVPIPFEKITSAYEVSGADAQPARPEPQQDGS